MTPLNKILLLLRFPALPDNAPWILMAFLWWATLFPAIAEDNIDIKTDSTTSIKTSTFTFLNDPFNGYWIFPDLHTGFNASVSMFTSIGIGGHHAGNTAFGQSFAFAWTDKLDKSKWSYALAAHTSSVHWNARQWVQASLSGSVQYSLNEKVSLIFSAYQQIFHPTNKYYGLYRNTWWDIPDRYWEGAVKFKVNDNCTIQVSAGTGKMQGNH